MFTLVLAVHLVVCVLLVIAVVLQKGKGAEFGAAFGGIGQATYGRTPSGPLTKVCTALAILFFITSLSLALISTEQRGSVTRSLIEQAAETTELPATTVETSPATESGATDAAESSAVEGASSPAEATPNSSEAQ